MNTRSGFQGLSPGMRIKKRIMLPSGSVIAGRDFVLFCFFPGFGFEFSQEVVHRPHAGMRIAGLNKKVVINSILKQTSFLSARKVYRGL